MQIHKLRDLERYDTKMELKDESEEAFKLIVDKIRARLWVNEEEVPLIEEEVEYNHIEKKLERRIRKYEK